MFLKDRFFPNFKAILHFSCHRRAAMSLEEAEAEMEKKHNSHFAGAGRLTQAIAKAEGTQPQALRTVHAIYAFQERQVRC